MKVQFVTYIKNTFRDGKTQNEILTIVNDAEKAACFLYLRAGILSKPGMRLIGKGYKREVAKLIRVSLIRYVWVFLYTAQKQER